MAAFTLTAKAGSAGRIDLSDLIPALITGAGAAAVSAIPVGGGAAPIRLGDVFAVSGEPGVDVTINAANLVVDGIAAGLAGGKVIFNGSAGNNAGRGMKGGTLEIRGNAGAYLGTGMKGGIIHVVGSAGDFVGGVASGKRFGMTGGTIVIDGNAGARAGDKMRRGLILVRGKTGEAAGSRMAGGTIVAEGGFGPRPGPLMRRGTLIGPRADEILATFADCGVHDLVILKLMARAWARELGPLAPRQLPQTVRRFAGDLAAIGKGELLVTAG